MEWTDSPIAMDFRWPTLSEDSKEFLTILGKKMGKLVKGGDAEPGRNKPLSISIHIYPYLFFFFLVKKEFL